MSRTQLIDLGIDPMMLANRGLLPCVEAECLEVAEIGSDGREHLLIPAAARAWRGMQVAAQNDGIALFIVSAFRSVERQAEIVQRKLAAGLSLDAVLAVCAPPGYSEHHSGCAVDISTPGTPALEATFDTTPAFAWLARHAGEFGFLLSYPQGNALGYQYEPWHWCHQGSAAHST